MGSAGYEEMTEHCPLIAFCNKTVKRYKGKPIPLDNIDQERQSADLQAEMQHDPVAYRNRYLFYRTGAMVRHSGGKIMELKEVPVKSE